MEEFFYYGKKERKVFKKFCHYTKECCHPVPVLGGITIGILGMSFGIGSNLYSDAGNFIFNELLGRVPDYFASGVDIYDSVSHARVAAHESIKGSLRDSLKNFLFASSCGYGLCLKFKSDISKIFRERRDKNARKI